MKFCIEILVPSTLFIAKFGNGGLIHWQKCVLVIALETLCTCILRLKRFKCCVIEIIMVCSTEGQKMIGERRAYSNFIADHL